MFTSGSQMTTAHGSYRGPSHHSMAGDSGYFHSGSRSAKSYSDTDFGKLFVYIFYKCSAVCLHFCFCFFLIGMRMASGSHMMSYNANPHSYQTGHVSTSLPISNMFEFVFFKV